MAQQIRYGCFPYEPGSELDRWDPCEGGKREPFSTRLSSDLYIPGTQELGAHWSANRGYLEGGGRYTELQSG